MSSFPTIDETNGGTTPVEKQDGSMADFSQPPVVIGPYVDKDWGVEGTH